MADDVDAANETLETYMDSALATRQRESAKPKPCLKGCGNDSFRTKNGVRTKYCRPCWVLEGSVPTSLEVEFAEIDAAAHGARDAHAEHHRSGDVHVVIDTTVKP